jgi:hypothetical protein
MGEITIRQPQPLHRPGLEMKIVLRIFVVFVGLSVIVTLASVLRLAVGGMMAVFIHSGALGLMTVGLWYIFLTAGPVASVQLWRLRRRGLFLTAILCALVFAYYVAGLVFLRAPGQERH